MRIRKSPIPTTDKIEQNMTPMIDVVFQLLAFFVMTFKIATQEGDFSIKMPAQAPVANPSPNDLIVHVKLTAGPDGELTSILWEDTPLDSFAALNKKVGDAVAVGVVDEKTGASSVEVELDCDYDLHYEHVVDAMTAVSGRIDPNTGAQNKLVEKLRFATPRPPGAAAEE